MLNLAQVIEERLPIASETIKRTRKQRRFSSKLEPYRLEILTLHNELNKSGAVIQQWLIRKQNLHVSISAIYKRIYYWRRLKELNDEKQTTEETN